MKVRSILTKTIMPLALALILILASSWSTPTPEVILSSNGLEQDCVPTVSQEVRLTEEESEKTLYRVTAYCACEKCCGSYALNRPVDESGQPIVVGAAGTRLKAYGSCASSLPFGTEVYIPDMDLHLTVQDRAAKWIDEKYDGMYIDIYVGTNHGDIYKYIEQFDDWMEVTIVK